MRFAPLSLWIVTACSEAAVEEARGTCLLTLRADAPDSAERLGCEADFLALASRPLAASIPGARSVKTVLDRVDGALYFQNSQRFLIHWDFASTHLSGKGLPVVPPLVEFNLTEYTSPERRFVLGALTHYEGPDTWVYEIAPYDTASAGDVTEAFGRIREAFWAPEELAFHPTSEAVNAMAESLALPIRTTDELYAGVDYQPLNLAVGVGKLRFLTAADLAEGRAYADPRDVVVLDLAPNDLTSVSGAITEAFQTPLSHVNVLAQNRGTPNMGLRGAIEHPTLRALEGRWVRLSVEAFDWTIEEVDRVTADAWWEAHRPAAVLVPRLDTETTAFADLATLLAPQLPLGLALDAVLPAYGGKASNYAALLQIPEARARPALGIPVHYFDAFMKSHGFYARLEGLLADRAFEEEPALRDAALASLRADMEAAPLDKAFVAALEATLDERFAPNTRMRFRSSTNAEDLDGFTGAGLYTSKTGDPHDPTRPMEDAIRAVWASVYSFRAFEERRYRGIDHRAVGMALLVHNSFPDELANGVALTTNAYDRAGLEPGFTVNVQIGELSVVLPDPGIRSDQFLLQWTLPGQPVIYSQHSNQLPAGTTVLTLEQVHELGAALAAVHAGFLPAYGGPGYAMDVEFKLQLVDGAPRIMLKQARPFRVAGSE